MRELVLKTLKEVLEKYPHIREYLEGKAKEIDKSGIEWHQKVKPYEGTDVPPYGPEGWDITEEDIERTHKMWDTLMPEFKGILDAKVEADPNKSVKDA